MPPTGTLLSPTGLPVVSAIPRECRQDALAFIAARRLGLTVEQADQMVAGMQAKRREWAEERRAAVAALDLKPGERMAARAERHATDVAAAREAERQRLEAANA